MNIKINSVRFDADQKLIDHVNKKVNKLGQFFDGIIGAEVFLRLENVQDDENKIAEIKLLIPGNDLFVKKQSKTFEEAINKAVESLNRQVTKYKQKLKGKYPSRHCSYVRRGIAVSMTIWSPTRNNKKRHVYSSFHKKTRAGR